MRSSRGILVCLALSTFLAACSSPAPAPAPPPAVLPAPPVQASAEPILAHPQPGSVDPGRTPPVVNHGPRTQNVVALTFDADMTDRDAGRAQVRPGQVVRQPRRSSTCWSERRIPATFFVTGKWAQRYPELIERIAGNRERYELANHTYRHAAYTPDCYNLAQLPRAEMTADARRPSSHEPYGGNQTRYFRFPGLCHDRPR